MEELLTGLKLNRKGVLTLVILTGVLLGLVLAVYLVGQRQIFQPKAYESIVQPVIISGSETSLSLKAPQEVQAGQEAAVVVYIHSDSDPSNLFAAKIKFPADLLKVEGFKTDRSFITNWASQSFDNSKGTITLIGGVPSPGVKTQAGEEGIIMAEIIFKAQAAGLVNLTLGDSAIFRNSDNANILTTKREASFESKEE
ncbi:MAG: hypothetical protein UU73_C0005G0051 [Candidatus Daviesbacteria bacterium GW2011_GWA1_41_61]|uniref:Cohesin domain-containing protein n=1 Tax=Candidatus Daviesbacteria bacterium GW2011_GWA2_40_9 TaxID=1618424 RepID=A0A0G0WH24_9BACT|nr:MAG: hypothetical protein UU26_C0041G0002 [Candidatus Daviesbacteria bacterium GW2011_GWC1_40_9]KKR83620.1 MAG: hypothetical protein UU29_C0003G0022 [Candidatus Daviesbacteria bacterium GW2011_GWA2_40_9]KKR92721.1 MAG: hypothetical protein UU44_C0005G0051 [Candidatus Daviesbacteria bacterium GW2011_GWB1_41_15]KKS14652.1 MAG: hypothetical protein UU73_C0005G0051 [Candidatus Daviesbacteria bacterium GW2011_GWA1_41_61]